MLWLAAFELFLNLVTQLLDKSPEWCHHCLTIISREIHFILKGTVLVEQNCSLFVRRHHHCKYFLLKKMNLNFPRIYNIRWLSFTVLSTLAGNASYFISKVSVCLTTVVTRQPAPKTRCSWRELVGHLVKWATSFPLPSLNRQKPVKTLPSLVLGAWSVVKQFPQKDVSSNKSNWVNTNSLIRKEDIFTVFPLKFSPKLT